MSPPASRRALEYGQLVSKLGVPVGAVFEYLLRANSKHRHLAVAVNADAEGPSHVYKCLSRCTNVNL
jgi:hypothetical protein